MSAFPVVDAYGHEGVRLYPVHGSYWLNLDTNLAVEVPQIQFIDDEVVEQFQFLDKFIVGPVYATTVVVAPWDAVHSQVVQRTNC